MSVNPSAAKPSAKRSGRARLTVRRFARNRLALVGLGIIVLLFLAAYIGPLVDKYDYTFHDYMAFTAPPGGDHWWGTNQGGQDLFALTMRGLQKSLVIGLLVGVISTLVAAAVGSFAAYYGGWVDRLLMWGVDLLLVLPSFLIIAVLSPAFRSASWRHSSCRAATRYRSMTSPPESPPRRSGTTGTRTLHFHRSHWK